MQDDEIKRIKRLSRKQVPRKQEREIPPRQQDPRKSRYSAKGEILRALEEEEGEDLSEESPFFEENSSPEESEEDSEKE